MDEVNVVDEVDVVDEVGVVEEVELASMVPVIVTSVVVVARLSSSGFDHAATAEASARMLMMFFMFSVTLAIEVRWG